MFSSSWRLRHAVSGDNYKKVPNQMLTNPHAFCIIKLSLQRSLKIFPVYCIIKVHFTCRQAHDDNKPGQNLKVPKVFN